jgi:uncharacterized protein
MKKRQKKKLQQKLKLMSGLLLVLLFGIFIGVIGQELFKDNEPIISGTVENEILISDNVGFIKVPAINSNGTGISTELFVKLEKGSGRTLVDIDNLLFWADTQNSIRMAKLVSENITGVKLDDYDLTFSINANASLIGGESAGAALALASIAAIQNITLNETVMITGTVNHDGSIGPIGGVLEKAKAAKQVGAIKFIVPLLQGNEIIYETIEHCETFGIMEWCSTERIPKQVDIANESGLEVIEVGSIEEALTYFIS